MTNNQNPFATDGSGKVSEELLQKLRILVGADYVLTSLPDCISYSRDLWPRDMLFARDGDFSRNHPDVIVSPPTAEVLAKLVLLAAEYKIPLIPYGAGSGVCGGTVPIHGGMVVDLKRLDRVISVDPDNLLVTAQAGILGIHLEKELNRRGYTLGHYPSSLYCSSLGGYLATRSAGQYSTRFGKIEDMVVSMTVVTGTGEVITTGPEAGQFDLTQVLVGNEGTYGIILEATLAIEAYPELRRYRGFKFNSIRKALNTIRHIMQFGLKPACVRLYDELDSIIALRKSDSDDGSSSKTKISKVGIPGLISHPFHSAWKGVSKELIRRSLGRPLLLNKAIDLLPGNCLLIIGFEGPEEITNMESEVAFDICRKSAQDLGEEPGLRWYENRFAISYKQSPMLSMGAFVDTMEVSATWTHLLNMYREVRKAVSNYVFVMAHFSHVYSEGSSIYFTFAGFGKTFEESLRKYDTVWRRGLECVHKNHGSVTHHHGVGLSKREFTHMDHKGGVFFFDVLKRYFDPGGIMNPGKVWISGIKAHE